MGDARQISATSLHRLK